ncbi:three prime repair exonuclease 2 isoform X2 [Pogona vitticeps]
MQKQEASELNSRRERLAGRVRETNTPASTRLQHSGSSEEEEEERRAGTRALARKTPGSRGSRWALGRTSLLVLFPRLGPQKFSLFFHLGLNMCAASESPSRPIETFVFLDLEATGLPPSRPKITELCLFAVARHAFENPQYDNLDSKRMPLFPRLVDKLCFCINPGKPFTPAASSITGLSNEELAWNKKQSFNIHVLHMITAFFNRQSPPICLVAHNGCGYDFPLLKVELSALGISGLDDIYCADTLKAMKALDSKNNQLHQLLYQASPLRSKKKYSLRDLYYRFYNVYPLNSHSAEGDVMTLISVFQQCATDLICWMDSNARPFNTIRAMYEENEKYTSFPQILPSSLQMQPQQRGVTISSFNSGDTKLVDSKFIPLHNKITDLPDEIKNVLLLFLGLIIVTWIALKTPV